MNGPPPPLRPLPPSYRWGDGHCAKCGVWVDPIGPGSKLWHRVFAGHAWVKR